MVQPVHILQTPQKSTHQLQRRPKETAGILTSLLSQGITRVAVGGRQMSVWRGTLTRKCGQLPGWSGTVDGGACPLDWPVHHQGTCMACTQAQPNCPVDTPWLVLHEC